MVAQYYIRLHSRCLSMLFIDFEWLLHLGEENVVDLPNVAFAVSVILYNG